jgi:cell division protein FtsB
MASAKKKAKQVDPISERARALNEQISALESEIKKIDTQLQRTTTPRFRSTAIPHGETVSRKSELPPAPKSISHEPVFEEVNAKNFQPEGDPRDRYNELGVRKYDLPALWERLCNHFRRPTTNNPRLVNYLAAGGVHGLKPMRYEKRVARNRFIALVVLLFLLLLGLICVFVRNH